MESVHDLTGARFLKLSFLNLFSNSCLNKYWIASNYCSKYRLLHISSMFSNQEWNVCINPYSQWILVFFQFINGNIFHYFFSYKMVIKYFLVPRKMTREHFSVQRYSFYGIFELLLVRLFVIVDDCDRRAAIGVTAWLELLGALKLCNASHPQITSLRELFRNNFRTINSRQKKKYALFLFVA